MIGPVDIGVNLASVRERIARAALRSGRAAADITLVAVTKTVPVETMNEAVRLGVRDIGENRVQEARSKFDAVGDAGEAVRWHMIGHLQSNKVKYALRMFDIIHSLDSLSLAAEIDRLAGVSGKPARVLVQVNVSGEESKYGLAPHEVRAFLERVSEMPYVAVEGLMTIAPFVDEAELARPHFRCLRELSGDIAGWGIPRIRMEHLSMGMTNDFEVAIEEGADIVRLGSAIFGPRSP